MRILLIAGLCLTLPVLLPGQHTVGLFFNDSSATNGYTLFSPSSRVETYLIDNCGYLVNRWTSDFRPGQSVYLLEDGSLLRTARINSMFNQGGTGGRIERFSWEGELEWAYNYSSDTFHQHHDIEPLSNGNVLVLAWEVMSQADAIAAGRNPALVGPNGLWPEHIVELEPVGADDANIVWEWHATDHLIQDIDSTKANFGVVADNPGRININYTGETTGADWLHGNSIDYHPGRDQIVISSRMFNEIWVIDHSTTTAEAASGSGGNSGRGGRILYRWGNPETYDRGTGANRVFYHQHDARWVDDGAIMVYNNGQNRPGPDFSSVDVILPPWDSVLWQYEIDPQSAYGPDSLLWSYDGQPDDSFYSSNISGAHRTAGGKTLVCVGSGGHFFEIDSAGNRLWSYVNPVGVSGPVVQGSNPSSNNVFRATRYLADDPAFAGRELIPGDRIEINPLQDDCTIYAEDTMTTAIRVVPEIDGISILGNPFGDALVIRNAGGHPLYLTVSDLLGQTLFAAPTSDELIHIPARHWPSGFLSLTLVDTASRQATSVKLLRVGLR